MSASRRRAPTLEPPAAAASGLSRNERRKAETRAKLIGAARRVIARKGFEATTIRNITDEADVGFGSFYNYFESKEAIAEEAVSDILTRMSEMIDASNEGLEDALEIMARAMSTFLRASRQDPVLSLFFLQFGAYKPELGRNMAESMMRDIRLGVEQGYFHVPHMETLVVMIAGAMFSFLRERIEGDLGPEADRHAVRTALRMMRAPDDEAARLSRRFCEDGKERK